jgi:hypothetical protein
MHTGSVKRHKNRGCFQELTYDNSDRLTGLTSPLLRLAYAYPTSKTFTLDLYEYGQLSIHEIAYINSASWLDSTFQ